MTEIVHSMQVVYRLYQSVMSKSARPVIPWHWGSISETFSSFVWRRNDSKKGRKTNTREGEKTDMHELLLPERKTFPARSFGPGWFVFAMSSTAHVHSHSHVFKAEQQQKNSTPPAFTAGPASRGEPQHRGPTFDRALILICQAGRSVNKKPRGNRQYDLKDELCVSVDRVSFSSDTAVIQCIIIRCKYELGET